MSGPPFVVLHVCLGNICRSPMAERLLARLVSQRLGDDAAAYVHSESAGTSGWHVGEPMHPPALRELRARGAVDGGFRARNLLGAHIDTADLILTATGEHLAIVDELRPDAAPRSFVLREFGRLLFEIDDTALPPVSVDRDPARPDPAAVYRRGVALVTAADAVRDGASPQPSDDLADPWGGGAAFFTRTADRIEAVLAPFVDRLLPG